MSRSASAAPRSPATVEMRANIGVCLPIALKIFALVKRVMSCVTVKLPWAPQPLACMRRSGITSRSKCASFSISQMSCSSAGPRGPAVMMLVLSATGAPVALVKIFDVDMVWFLLMDGKLQMKERLPRRDQRALRFYEIDGSDRRDRQFYP